MNIVFFGSSGFALPSLEVLLKSGGRIQAVVTAPDAKRGRGLKISFSPVKDFVVQQSLVILQPEEISDREFINRLKEFKPDLFVVVAYGRILTKEILNIPSLFSVNLHASVLPKYRGPAPINWALINGEPQTGVSIIRMDEFIDTGDIILQQRVSVMPDDDALTLADKLSDIGASVLIEAVEQINDGKAKFAKQSESESSLAPRLKKAMGAIDWQMSAQDIHNRVRGLLPWPCAFTKEEQKILKVLKSAVIAGDDENVAVGTIVSLNEEDGIVVKTGRDKLALKYVQLEGGRPMGASDFVRGHKLKIGLKLGAVV